MNPIRSESTILASSPSRCAEAQPSGYILKGIDTPLMLTLVRLDAGTAPGRQLGRAADAVELRSAATIVSQIGQWSMPWRRASISSDDQSSLSFSVSTACIVGRRYAFSAYSVPSRRPPRLPPHKTQYCSALRMRCGVETVPATPHPRPPRSLWYRPSGRETRKRRESYPNRGCAYPPPVGRNTSSQAGGLGSVGTLSSPTASHSARAPIPGYSRS